MEPMADQVIVVDRNINVLSRDTSAGRTASLGRFELLAAWNTAADLFDDFA